MLKFARLEKHKNGEENESPEARSRSVAALAFIGACATEPEKPAPTPAPVVKPAPAPQPQAVPAPPPPPPPAPVAKPEPKPEPPKKPAVVNLASTELFEFNKAVLTQDARAKLDSEVVAKLRDLKDVRYIIVNGHADRLGSPQYNQRLSEKRADAVRAYLVSKGVDASKVETSASARPCRSSPAPTRRTARG